MPAKRRSGILLHPTSLPGAHGSGDLGPTAFHFVDWLAAAGQTLWQVLPLGGIGPGNSPYMSPSALAGNELLIDLTQLVQAGWLKADEITPEAGFSAERVNYPAIKGYRMDRLRRAARRFFAAEKGKERQAFDAFCATCEWLEDYALFMTLDQQHGQGGKVWQDWPGALAQRQPEALRAAAVQHADECAFWKFCQWCFHRQWAALKQYANSHGIAIIGDMPIFVSPHSADVWAHQELFDLDKTGRPRVIAGVPPDYFSATGQRWGNPLYRWPAHQAENYRWWITRMRVTLALCDIVRIDHFRGFESYWEIPATEKTAVKGKWQPGPGLEFFNTLYQALGIRRDSATSQKIIAEDLGIITAEVNALRQAIGVPGMRILQFAFDGKSDNLYLPHNYDANTVVYTGTHDNDTTPGWWRSLAAHEQAHIRRYLGVAGEGDIHWPLIHAASASVATLCVIPLQDVLGLDSAHRMNMPGQGDGFWEWRFNWSQVAPWHAERLLELARLHGRAPDSPQPAA